MKLSEELADSDPVVYLPYRKPNKKNLLVKVNFHFSEHARGQKIQFLAFKTMELARKYIKDKYEEANGSLELDDAVGYFQPVQKLDDKQLIGVIVTGGEWIKDVIINHECSHAVFHWFVRNGRGHRIDEEEFCTKLGSLSASVLRICLEALPVNELLPPDPDNQQLIRYGASNAKSRKRKTSGSGSSSR